jgi:hypothetical protein
MDKIYIGIDNGPSGAVGVIGTREPALFPTPTILQQDYTKKKQNLSRLKTGEFLTLLSSSGEMADNLSKILVLFERPLVNPMRFRATLTAIRCLEAQLVVVEILGYPYMFVDSRAWQKELLPEGCSKEELKHASRDIGIRLFPTLEEQIKKQKDADAIFIAEWARRKGL